MKKTLCTLACIALVISIALCVLVACNPDEPEVPTPPPTTPDVPQEYTIAFDSDGTTYHSIKTSGKETLSLPTAPTKSRYIFGGWYFDKDVWTNEFSASSYAESALSADVTVYAKWNEDSSHKMNVTVTDGGGIYINSVTAKDIDVASMVFVNPLVGIKAGAFDETDWYKAQPDGAVYIKDWFYKYKGTMPANTQLTIKEGTVGIADSALDGKSALTGITIPNSVVIIGQKAFQGCGGLTTLTLPNSLTVMSANMLYNCLELTDLTLPSSLKKVEAGATAACVKLSNIRFGGDIAAWCGITGLENLMAGIPNPDFVKSDANDSEYVYLDKMDLKLLNKKLYISGTKVAGTLTIPDSVTSISNAAFQGCDEITSVTFPANLKSIGSRAFYRCRGITSITIPNSVTVLGELAFRDCRSLSSVTLSNKIESIGKEAFRNTGLASIVIPEGVKALDVRAFGYCRNLANVTIPDSVVSLSDTAFEKTVWETDLGGTVENGMIYMGKVLYKYVYGFTGADVDVVVKDGTKGIADNAFVAGNMADGDTRVRDKIASVTLPNSLESIGKNAFQNCSNITSITIPASVKTIGANAFQGCTVTIIENNESQGNASQGNTSQGNPQITIRYTGLQEIRYKGDIGGWCKIIGVENIMALNRTLYIYNQELSGAITIPEGVTTLEPSVFNGCKNLTNVVLPTSLTSIGANAFSGCRSLRAIDLFDGITSIGVNAFKDCSALRSIRIPESVTEIGNGAFQYCNSLSSLTIPNGVKTIGDSAFKGCGNFSNLTISNSETKIAENAFQDCLITTANVPTNAITVIPKTVLEAIVITKGTEIPSNAFKSCVTLKDVTLPASVTTIGTHAFTGCTSLRKVEYFGNLANWCKIKGLGTLVKNSNVTIWFSGRKADPTMLTAKNLEGVTTISPYAFAGFKTLVSVELPNTIVKIDDYAFAECVELRTIVLPDSVTSIGIMAFEGCTSLTSITIPSSVTSISEDAFYGCNGLRNIVFQGTRARWTTLAANMNLRGVTVKCSDDPAA